jgi:XTP/dITP diphosphohydrolase
VEIVIASQNEGKLKEFGLLLEPHQLVQSDIDVEETGLSFHENALLKARACAGDKQGIFIGDDSGIMIDKLGGMPGIHSKRWRGASDLAQGIQNVIEDVSKHEGPYHCMMVCCIALVTYKEDPLPMFFLGIIPGEFRVEPKGNLGFGYDPYFFVHSLNKTFSEISIEEKGKHSHRRQASDKLKMFLNQLENNPV